jgi:hypothetical protein
LDKNNPLAFEFSTSLKQAKIKLQAWIMKNNDRTFTNLAKNRKLHNETSYGSLYNENTVRKLHKI